MARVWTDGQKKAIQSRKGNFIVSASAGSGKTAVLTERVFQIIDSGVSIDRLLVLTFGNAAAQEMKDRIRKALVQNNKLEEASKLDLAAIQTFDSFAYSIVKKYYYLVGLNENIKIINQSILEVEKRRILQQKLDILVANPPKIFSDIIYKFCLRTYDPIFEFVLLISSSIEKFPNREAMYDQIRNEFLTEDYYKRVLSSIFGLMRKKLNENSEYINYLSYTDEAKPNANHIEKFVTFYDALNEHSQSYDDLADYLNNSTVKHPAKSKLVQPSGILDLIKENFSFIKKFVGKYGSTKAILDKFNDSREECLFILDLAQSLDSELDNFKRKHNSFDFIDIARYALNILDNEEVLKEFRNRFEYIMVDEYQDTSDMQDAVIKKLTNENLFLVGDVKQSIYRFRLANPSIFLKRFNDYGRGEGGERIDLSHNFRSRPEVVNDNNELFKKLMNKDETEFNYEADHMMIPGNPVYNQNKSKQNMRHELYSYPYSSSAMMVQQEIQIMISDICEKINKGYLVYDGSENNGSGGLRKVRYSDFSILIDRATDFDKIVTNFKKSGIPIKVIGASETSDSPVLLSIISLLKVYIHNIETSDLEEFKHAYVSLLRSFIFAYSDEKIYNIVHDGSFYKDDAYLQIQDIRKKAKYLSLSRQFEMLVSELNIANKITSMGNINENNAVLNYVYDLIKSMEDLSYSYEDVVSYFVDLNRYSIKIENELLDDSNDSVTLMTIHKSKGLQFKIVYLPLLFKEPKKDTTSQNLVFNPKYGIQMGSFKNIEDEDSILSNTGNILSDYIKEQDKRENLLERVRLFYVALTRPEEKAIMLYPVKEGMKPILTLSHCDSFYDFLSYGKAEKIFSTKTIDVDNLYNSISVRPKENAENYNIVINPKLTMSNDMIKSTRASRSDTTEIDPDALAIGNQFHEYLELVDFNNPDISFIKDKNHQQILANFLKNPLILGLRKTKILHEFAFYDTLNQREGIIDLISISEDVVKVIDYKTSHIDNPAYDNQIRTYVSYLKTLPILKGKKFEGYLISIMKNQYRAVDLTDL